MPGNSALTLSYGVVLKGRFYDKNIFFFLLNDCNLICN